MSASESETTIIVPLYPLLAILCFLYAIVADLTLVPFAGAATLFGVVFMVLYGIKKVMEGP